MNDTCWKAWNQKKWVRTEISIFEDENMNVEALKEKCRKMCEKHEEMMI